MKVVGGEQLRLQGAVDVREVARQIEDPDLGVALEFEEIEGGVGEFDILIKTIPRRVGGRDLREDERRVGEVPRQVGSLAKAKTCLRRSRRSSSCR